MKKSRRAKQQKSKPKFNFWKILGLIVIIVLLDVFYQYSQDLIKTLTLLGFCIAIFGIARLGSKIPFGKGSNSGVIG